MIIIGHRGAKGLAPENTLLAITRGIQSEADAVEFDVHPTKDGVLVLCHDPDLRKTAKNKSKISDFTLTELKTTETLSGESIPTLKEAISIAGKTPLLIEGKGSGWAKLLAAELNEYEGLRPTVISKNHQELATFKHLRPDLKLYAISHINVFSPIIAAKNFGFAGIGINYLLMNPLVYFLIIRAKLELTLYTIDRPFIVKIIKLLYPKTIAITTNYPDRLKRGL